MECGFESRSRYYATFRGNATLKRHSQKENMISLPKIAAAIAAVPLQGPFSEYHDRGTFFSEISNLTVQNPSFALKAAEIAGEEDPDSDTLEEYYGPEHTVAVAVTFRNDSEISSFKIVALSGVALSPQDAAAIAAAIAAEIPYMKEDFLLEHITELRIGKVGREA